jgi:hypothetical protein
MAVENFRERGYVEALRVNAGFPAVSGSPDPTFVAAARYD